ncbi:MAG TPA: SRPBCC family protein, partial [Sandaracinaceae bacterium LLY-WYZ-13_1]|nr:SRPBCC family protein [Sandaracinaceae bacterium LLY-WYZ-13_1]
LQLPARAQRSPHDAREARLEGFSRAELTRIEPLLADGAVFGLVDRSEGPLLPAVHLALRVDAPARVVAAVLSDPAGYPGVIPAVDAVEVTERSGGVTGFTWRWHVPLGQLEGDAMLTALGGGGPRGARVVVERTAGDLGRGREVWRVLPRGPDASLLLLSSRIDARGASGLGRTSLRLNRAIEVATSVGLALRMAEGAERRAGVSSSDPGDAPLTRPPIDLGPLEPLMRRGDLFWLEATRGALRRVALMTRYNRTEAQVREQMRDPRAVGPRIFSRSVRLEPEAGDEGRFAWHVDHPLIGASGTMALRERADDVIALDALDGTLAGGRWRFVTTGLPSRATGVLGWGRFDVGDLNPLLRDLVDADASLGSGLGAATWVAVAWALRQRLRHVPPTGVHRHMR